MNFTSLMRILKQMLYLFMTIITFIIYESVPINETHVEVEESNTQTDKPIDDWKGLKNMSEHPDPFQLDVYSILFAFLFSLALSIIYFLCRSNCNRGFRQFLRNFINRFFCIFVELEEPPAGIQPVHYEGGVINLPAF